MNKALKEIIKTESQVLESGSIIKNDIIKSVNVSVVGHFGNCACLEIVCTDRHLIAGYNNTANLGVLLKSLVEFLNLSDDNGINIREIRNIPIRLIINGGEFGKVVGFGDFMQDRFIYTQDFVGLSIEKLK